MEKIKVIVAGRPRLIREIVLEMIANQPDIELMAEVQDDSKLVDLIGDLHPDWILVSFDRPDQQPDICYPLFNKFPNLKILALTSDRNNCIFYWADVSVRSSRVECSEKGVMDALRGRRPVAPASFAAPGSKRVN